MERLPVYRGASRVGIIEVTREGLYWRISAVCTGQPLERLWLHTTGHRHCLGPLEPENGLLVCRGRVSLAALEGESITHAVAVPASDHWEQRGTMTLYGRRFADVLVREDNVAIAFDPDGPFPLPGEFCLCCVERIHGAWYVVVPHEV